MTRPLKSSSGEAVRFSCFALAVTGVAVGAGLEVGAEFWFVVSGVGGAELFCAKYIEKRNAAKTKPPPRTKPITRKSRYFPVLRRFSMTTGMTDSAGGV